MSALGGSGNGGVSRFHAQQWRFRQKRPRVMNGAADGRPRFCFLFNDRTCETRNNLRRRLSR